MATIIIQPSAAIRTGYFAGKGQLGRSDQHFVDFTLTFVAASIKRVFLRGGAGD